MEGVSGNVKRTARCILLSSTVAYPGILFGCGGSPNSVEDRGQREGDRGSVAP